MATRYYLSNSAAAAVSPAFDATWTTTAYGMNDHKAMDTTKSNSSLVANSVNSRFGTGKTCDIHAAAGCFAMRQWVGPQIGVFNFNGTTVSLVLKCHSGGSGMSVTLNLSVRLYHTGGTLTTLLAASAANYDTAFAATAATRIVRAVALANITSSEKDRLVVEIGGNMASISSLCRSPDMTDGDPSATADYALTTALTTDLDPWVEFSGSLPFPLFQSGQFFQFFR